MARLSTVFFGLLLFLYAAFAIAALVLHAIARGDSSYRRDFEPAFHGFGLTGACLMIVLVVAIGAGFFMPTIFEFRPLVVAIVFLQCVAQFFLCMALGILVELSDAFNTSLGDFKNGLLTIDFLAIFFGFSVTSAYVYRSLKRYATEHK